jgi:hypothetical protein
LSRAGAVILVVSNGLLLGLLSRSGALVLSVVAGLVPLSCDRRGLPRRDAGVTLGDLPGRADERTNSRSPILELFNEIVGDRGGARLPAALGLVLCDCGLGRGVEIAVDSPGKATDASQLFLSRTD